MHTKLLLHIYTEQTTKYIHVSTCNVCMTLLLEATVMKDSLSLHITGQNHGYISSVAMHTLINVSCSHTICMTTIYGGYCLSTTVKLRYLWGPLTIC